MDIFSVVSTRNIVAEYVVAEYVKYPCGVRCCRYNSFKERVILILSYFKLIINRIVIKVILKLIINISLTYIDSVTYIMSAFCDSFFYMYIDF